jgi:hypothetical protein
VSRAHAHVYQCMYKENQTTNQKRYEQDREGDQIPKHITNNKKYNTHTHLPNKFPAAIVLPCTK